MRLPVHAKVYNLAQKLKIPNLEDLSVYYFATTLQEDPGRVLSKHFQEAAAFAYSTTLKDDQELRPAIINAIRRYPQALEDAAFQDFLRTHPDLSLELTISYQKFGRHTDNYNPEPSQSTLYIGCLPSSANEDSIRRLFSPSGKVVNVKLPRYP